MSSSESSTSRSPSPPPKKSPKKELSKNFSEKAKKKAATKITPEDGSGKNEGPDPNWDYKPPRGAVLLQDNVDAKEFDWEKVNNDEDAEVWLIRVPYNIKPSHLENKSIHLPASSSKSERVGNIKMKHAIFDIWALGDEDAEDQPVGGEEIKNMRCLLPRKGKKGKLYPAPRPIARHLVVSARTTKPTVDPDAPIVDVDKPYKNPPREKHPKDLLTHKFMPYGSLVNVTNEHEQPDHDVVMEDAHAKKAKDALVDSPTKHKSKSKKRKGEDDVDASPSKKSKKVKTAS